MKAIPSGRYVGPIGTVRGPEVRQHTYGARSADMAALRGLGAVGFAGNGLGLTTSYSTSTGGATKSGSSSTLSDVQSGIELLQKSIDAFNAAKAAAGSSTPTPSAPTSSGYDYQYTPSAPPPPVAKTWMPGVQNQTLVAGGFAIVAALLAVRLYRKSRR